MVKVPLMSCVVGLGVLSLLPGMGCAFTRSALFRHPEMRHASAPRIFPSESVKAHERRTSKGLNSAALATVIAEHPFATAAIFCGAKGKLHSKATIILCTNGKFPEMVGSKYHIYCASYLP